MVNHGPTMKKLISITLRLLLAAAGIGYIVFTLSWQDRVVIPQGYTFVDGTQAQSQLRWARRRRGEIRCISTGMKAIRRGVESPEFALAA